MNSIEPETKMMNVVEHKVKCRFISNSLIEPIEFTGEPIYFKMDMYGYLIPLGNKVLFFYANNDGIPANGICFAKWRFWII